MDFLFEKLFNELLKFVEISQKKVIKNEINKNEYCTLVNKKLDFVKNLLDNEEDVSWLRRKTEKRINSVFVFHSYIISLNKKVAGK